MERYKNGSARIAPAPEPLPADVQQAIDAIMRGNPPLVLFTTLARDHGCSSSSSTPVSSTGDT